MASALDMRVHPAVEVPSDSGAPAVHTRRRAGGRSLSRSGRVIVWLLRLFGQMSGGSCLAWLYASAIYVAYSMSLLFVAAMQGVTGADSVKQTGAFFTAAINWSLFGTTYVLSWLTTTCTFFVGRRRYKVLLAGLEQAMNACMDFNASKESSRKLNRRFIGILLGSFLSTILILSNTLWKLKLETACKQSVGVCVTTLLEAMALTILGGAMFLVTLKLTFAGDWAASGFQTVCSEIQAMADTGRVELGTLRRLKKCQAAVSASFAQLKDGMTPELIACMLYGTIAQVTSFLLIVSTIQRGTGFERTPDIMLQLWGAFMTVMLPCEVGQRVLDEVSRTRSALLSLPPADVTTNQEVLLFLETTRRDLDELGDLRLYQLRRSTVLAITSAVITYIIVLLQFQLTEV